MSHICYICSQWKSDNRASLAQHIRSCRKLMNKKQINTHTDDFMNHEMDDNECNYNYSSNDSHHVFNVEENEEQNDNDSILSASLDDDSIEIKNDMDTTKFLDTIKQNHLMEYLQYTNLKNDKTTDNIPDIMIAAIELLTILKNAKASLSLYNKIIDWVLHCKACITTDRLPARERVMNFLSDRYNLSCIKPTERDCVLPSIALPIKIPVIPTQGCIYLLLTNPALMKAKNLLWDNPNDPSFVPPFERSNDKRVYGATTSGMAYHSYCQTKAHIPNAVVIPIIIFTDGTFIDVHGRHTQEPVMMTLAIFNDEIRRKPEAWRHLGFIRKNGTSMYSREDIKEAHANVTRDDVPDNHNDFHAQMRIILGDLKLIQELEEGVLWQFTIDGKTNPTIYRVFFPILYIIGDTMEHNKLVSLNNGPTSALPC